MENKNTPLWFSIISLIVSSFVALSVYFISTKDNDNQIGQKYVELSWSILKEKSKGEEYTKDEKVMREWAIRVLNNYSEIKLSEEEQKFLMENPIPTYTYEFTSKCKEGTCPDPSGWGCIDCDSIKK